MIWNAVVTSTLSQTQLPGIQSLGYSGKMSEVVTSSNIHIQRDPADSQPLSPWDGVEKCWKWLLLPTYSNGPRWLVGIQWAFKQTQGTFIFKLHWVSSTIQFVGCAHLRTQFTCLRTELMVEVAERLYFTGKMSDPGALNQKQPTPRLRGTFISQLHWVSSTIQFVGCAHLSDALT